jgi:hypothetical protein
MSVKELVPALFLVCACGGSSTPAPDAKPPDASSADATVNPCPDEAGAYSIALTGAGCGNLSATASECVMQDVCTITLTTTGGGLAGTTPLGTDGSFANGAITEGTGNRTGCTGTWDPGKSTLTVDCGGIGSGQSCIATLTRTASSCP